MSSTYIRNTDKCSSYTFTEDGMRMSWDRLGYEDENLGVLDKATVFMPFDRTQPPTFSVVALQSSSLRAGYEDVPVTSETMKLLALDILGVLLDAEDAYKDEYSRASGYAEEIEYVLQVGLRDYLAAQADSGVAAQASLAAYRAGMVSGLVDGIAGSVTADLNWFPFDVGWIKGVPLTSQFFRHKGHFAGVTRYVRWHLQEARMSGKLPERFATVELLVDSLITFDVGFGPQGFYCNNEDFTRNKALLFMQGLNAHFDNQNYYGDGMVTLTSLFNLSQIVNV